MVFIYEFVWCSSRERQLVIHSTERHSFVSIQHFESSALVIEQTILLIAGLKVIGIWMGHHNNVK